MESLLVAVFLILIVLALAVYMIQHLFDEQPFQRILIAIVVMIGIVLILKRMGML